MIQIRHIKDGFFAPNIKEIVRLEHKPSLKEIVEAHEERKPLIGAVKKSLLALVEQEKPRL